MFDDAKDYFTTATCGIRSYCRARGRFVNYRKFLLDPGTLFTLASGMLLILAILCDPSGLFHDESDESVNNLYLAAALVGSGYIWRSALQGIRGRDFTADIPASIATMAAIAIGEYSAAAMVAVLLLVGELMEEFVTARANQSLQSLARHRSTRRRSLAGVCLWKRELATRSLPEP